MKKQEGLFSILFGVNVNSKINLLTVLLLICTSNALASISQDKGSIAFNGSISVPTCEVDTKNPLDRSIGLKSISADKIRKTEMWKTIPDTEASMIFSLVCTDSTADPKIKIMYTTGASENLLQTTGSGKGVGIIITETQGTPVKNGDVIPMHKNEGDDAKYSLTLLAASVKTGDDIIAGDITATATVEVIGP
ncbi:fimbrial protein [Salmonella enterica subsp. enterica]|nr:fimbrial protein [Salmonella enterica subsp. enterica serovar Miami]